MNALYRFDNGGSYCILDKFKDVELDLVKFDGYLCYISPPSLQGPSSLTAPDKPIVTVPYLFNNKQYSPKIMYWVSRADATSNICSIVVSKEMASRLDEEADLTKIERLNEQNILWRIKQLPLPEQKHFVRHVMRLSKQGQETIQYEVMDYFQYNLARWRAGQDLSEETSQEIANFISRAVLILYNLGLCYTDIKLEQVLIRPVSLDRRRYYYTIKHQDRLYELALTDMDMGRCASAKDRRIYTFLIPKVLLEAIMIQAQKENNGEALGLQESISLMNERQLIWSYFMTITDVFGFNMTMYKVKSNMPDKVKLTNLDQLLNKIVHYSNIPEDYKNILSRALDIKNRNIVEVIGLAPD